VFASILDRFPGAAVDGPADEEANARLQRVLRAQFDAGMGILGDGIVWDVTGAADEVDPTDAIDAAVAAWNDAADIVRALAEAGAPGIEPPLLKACLLGPWTAVSRARARTLQLAADRVHRATELLFDAGAPIVQVVEDGLAELDPGDAASVAAARSALERAARAPTGHLSLSVGGGNVDQLGPAFFFDLPVASFAFDLVNGPENWRLINKAPQDRGILCGVADCRTSGDDEEAVMVWAARYAASTGDRGLQRVGLCPSSGFASLSDSAAARKLAGLASAARKAGLPPDELATAIDPRAVDARSAALGRVAPSRRPGAQGPQVR
jgi:hypothetical protein